MMEVASGERAAGNRKREAGSRQSRFSRLGLPAPLRAFTSGGVLGMLIWVAADQAGIGAIPLFRQEHLLLVFGIVGGIIGLTRARPLLWGAALLICAVVVGIGYTPWAESRVRSLARTDPVGRCDAVVVLSSDVWPNGELPSQARLRLLRGIELLHAGHATQLVLTRLLVREQSAVPASRRQMERLGAKHPIIEVGPVFNTHDEAVVVAKLAGERGWKRVLLVSDPTHMRRAGATFEKQGLAVICAPCPWRRYDPNVSLDPRGRLEAFRDWLHEWIGYEIYRRNGWL